MGFWLNIRTVTGTFPSLSYHILQEIFVRKGWTCLRQSPWNRFFIVVLKSQCNGSILSWFFVFKELTYQFLLVCFIFTFIISLQLYHGWWTRISTSQPIFWKGFWNLLIKPYNLSYLYHFPIYGRFTLHPSKVRLVQSTHSSKLE